MTSATPSDRARSPEPLPMTSAIAYPTARAAPNARTDRSRHT
jgi:hypothetical protein